MSGTFESKSNKIKTAGTFPEYAPLTDAGKEYDKNKPVNPFQKAAMENFFSADFLSSLPKSTGNLTATQQYMIELYKVAEGFIKGDPATLTRVSPLVLGVNPIHPFLEPSGAIRVQVPLPQNMEELYILADQILGNKTKNAPNNDMYLLTPKGLADPKFPAPWVNAGLEEIYLKGGEKPYYRGLMIWDDASGYAGINKDYRCPNLLLLLLSIVFQQTDVDAYGARGRYGDATLKRLLDGHGIQCGPKVPSHRMVALISFNAETGMPRGYISAATYKTDVGSGSGAKEVETIFNHYAFVPNCSPYLGQKMTSLMYIFMLAYISTYVTRLELKNHFLVAHSDKSPAIKAICSAGAYYPENKIAYKAIADGAYDAITPLDSRATGLKEDASVPSFPHIQFYDQSTVPRDDPGEEVPVPADRFYVPVYADYCRIVKAKDSTANPPELLVNGVIEDKDLPRLREIAKKYGYGDEKPLLSWMQKPGSFGRGKSVMPYGLIDGNRRVTGDFPINDRKQKNCILVDNLNPKPKGNTDALKEEILVFLIQAAKNGNTGNIDYPKTPRLTDFAYMVSYQPPTGIGMAMDWGVAFAVQYLAFSFAWLQEEKVRFLGPVVSEAHLKITIKDITLLSLASIAMFGLWAALSGRNTDSKL